MRAEQEAEFHEYMAARTDRMRRFAYLYCGDWHRAEDAVQTAFIRLYAKWNRAKRASLDAYTRRIVVNVLIDEHRRGWFRRERSHSEPLDTATPTDHTADTEVRMVVRAALDRLPSRQRIAVILRHWEDLPVEQVARIMRCSTGTMKSR